MKGVDKYGCVTDLNLAKRIIIEKFTGWPYIFRESEYSCIGTEKTLKEWLNRVEEDLIKVGHCGYTIKQKSGCTSLGGPDGWSGFIIQEANSYFLEEELIKELDFNPNDEVLCTIYDEEDNKFVTFVLHELD